VRTALDTNVLSALWSHEPLASRMAQLLGQAQAAGALVIAAPVYAELLAHPQAEEPFVKEFLKDTHIRVDFDLDESVWSRAGQGFCAYAKRRRSSGGGEPRRLLVDFLIGAHAELRAERLLTLDPTRYTQDFPALRLMEVGLQE
jgi:predicted nucleic acid-binding protein